jgi:hypothetical protein
VNENGLLATLLTVTTAGLLPTSVDALSFIVVAFHVLTATALPFRATVLVPWVDPKFVPVMVNCVPTAAGLGEIAVIVGTATTVKLEPLLFTPLANTTTLPVVAPDGTVVAMLVALQLVIVAVVPLNLTVPLP